MPAVARSEFALALNQVCSERGIEPEVVVETIKAAILAAYRKDFGPDTVLEELTVEINADTGEAKILKEGKDITPPGFGRIAAQTAKQVILQRIREAEKKAIISDYTGKIGALVSGMVLRFDGPNVVVDIGKAEAVMPPQEQIQNERYHLNQRLTFYIANIRETGRGSEIVVSRAHKGLVEGLFFREVPEVQNGSVEIKNIAREAGSRSKVAVASTQSGVDPVGSCVGQKGVRVQAVINELGGTEKIDIIQWSEDVKKFLASALAPAKEIEISLDEKKQTAVAAAPEEQLSLAIGKEGQNVRLAAKLTGWKIDIKSKNAKAEESAAAEKETSGKKLEDKTTAGETDTAEGTKKPAKKPAKKAAKKADDKTADAKPKKKTVKKEKKEEKE